MKILKGIVDYIKYPNGNPDLASRWEHFLMLRAIKRMSKRTTRNPLIIENNIWPAPSIMVGYSNCDKHGESYDEPYRHIDFDEFKALIS